MGCGGHGRFRLALAVLAGAAGCALETAGELATDGAPDLRDGVDSRGDVPSDRVEDGIGDDLADRWTDDDVADRGPDSGDTTGSDSGGDWGTDSAEHVGDGASDVRDGDGSSCVPAGPEVCNGLDDNCDGATDNGAGFTCVRGASEACTASVCGAGHRACDPERCVWGGCVPDVVDCSPGDWESCYEFMCGAGRRSCGADCRWGGCESCPSGRTCCLTGCTDTRADLLNCGRCGRICILSRCVEGECVSW